MSQQQDAGSLGRPRQRANTTSFWRRRPDNYTPSPPQNAPSTHQPLSLDALIEALRPPAVPSLAHARALANLLTNASPLPKISAISPVLSSLCDINGPPSFQAAGFDVISSYLENQEATVLQTADRLSFFSLFLGSNIPWAAELWEPRLRALGALTRKGTDIVGIELALINVVKCWVEGAFDRLLSGDRDLDRAERSEREKSLDVLVKFLSNVLDRSENIARFSDDTIPSVLRFYASLVDRSIVSPESPAGSNNFSASTDSLTSPSHSKFGLHRRNTSLSATSLTSPTTPLPSSTPQNTHKQPSEIAITIYLDYLQTQIKTLSPPILNDIFPLLFRALASCASLLPRLTVLSHPHKKSALEDRIIETLTSIYNGPYSTTCVAIHKRCLYPEFIEEDEGQLEASDESQQTSENSTTRQFTYQVPWISLQLGILTSLGAYRMLRSRVRHVLTARLARAYILRETSIGYSYSGAPSHIDVEQDLMEKAWPREDYAPNAGIGLGTGTSVWDARRIGPAFAESVACWIEWISEGPHTPTVTYQNNDFFKQNWDRERGKADQILEEAAGLLKDILQEADSREEDSSGLSDEEAAFVGQTLFSLCKYIHPLRNPDGSPFTVPLDNPSSAPTPLLRSITSLLARDHTISLNPLLSTMLIHIAENLTDKDTARLPAFMLEQHELSPTSPEWLLNWENLLGNTTAVSSRRPMTKCAVLEVFAVVYDSVKEMPAYRRPLADLVFKFCKSWVGKPEAESEEGDSLWKILGDEIVLRATEAGLKKEEDAGGIDELINLLKTVASEPSTEEVEDMADAQSALSVNAFSQLAFTPHVLEDHLHQLALRLYHVLLVVLTQGQSARGKLTVLQFLMRLRADRDHGIFFISRTYDKDNQIALLSGLINRSSLPPLEKNIEDSDEDYVDSRKSRPKAVQEREERQSSRGRGGAVTKSAGSRSRSRAPARASPSEVTKKLRPPLWNYPETVLFTIAEVDTVSEALISYHPEGTETHLVLEVSLYLKAIIGILERETSWDVLSYVLCHLPTQLSNKHFWCGPTCRQLIPRLLNVLCTGILKGELGFYVEAWPPGLKPRDAQGLAHHSLSVLVSYRRCFEPNQRHVLVEVFQQGLDGQLSTIKCCLHSLTLSAFELRSSVTRCMPRILEKLSQIMSNPNMSVHILAFLSIVGSLPALYANFTEADYKMVFGVALQYLQHYNRLNSSPTMSWALSQYVRIMSYTAVYTWFLALKLPDRPKHMPYITRQLMLANESNKELDVPTEVCFDWLARNAYATADPRPATSSFSEVVMNPVNHLSESGPAEVATQMKSWIV
ncbi:hypothetical protein AN958_09765 [Leucoagaricus sp. SymC.cos]|nr:hypothetical protein AN958_09765 [Leucoagaricus sp. SymC.cos]